MARSGEPGGRSGRPVDHRRSGDPAGAPAARSGIPMRWPGGDLVVRPGRETWSDDLGGVALEWFGRVAPAGAPAAAMARVLRRPGRVPPVGWPRSVREGRSNGGPVGGPDGVARNGGPPYDPKGVQT